jgi:hypothetical protein
VKKHAVQVFIKKIFEFFDIF